MITFLKTLDSNNDCDFCQKQTLKTGITSICKFSVFSKGKSLSEFFV